ncbi:MAG: hypothetical protein J7463_12690 [Roseiflexus sp.]|nr:hypothetical protein [Roseiflexus sp.]MBO9336386.1 hypothetical protein [Roseiflexus sp.]MBO9363624.1 hypothetical protein [Roseiflexus sp.]MBO9383722.1 hypothetical protein [Roseiflexus sp.]MBO9387738.1 hypothetical protein [Roseiflexus sp.]
MLAFRRIFALLVVLLIACEIVEGGRMPGAPVPLPTAPATPVTPHATAPGLSYPYPSL